MLLLLQKAMAALGLSTSTTKFELQEASSTEIVRMSVDRVTSLQGGSYLFSHNPQRLTAIVADSRTLIPDFINEI